MPSCELSGKSVVVKNLVSHSNIKTKSRALPNIQNKKFFSFQLKRAFKFKVSSRAIRNIDKVGGFDVYITQQKDNKLSSRALKVKNQILKKTKMKKSQKAKEVQDEVKN